MACFTSKQLKIIKTCNLFLSYAVSGLAMTVVGASLLDLQHVVKTDTKNIAFVFVARSAGYLFGLVFGAPLLDKTSRKLLVMTILNFLMAITVFAVPLSRSMEMMLGWMALNGMSIGTLDTGLNTYCLNLWGKDSGPVFQAQTFAFGIGGLIAPLIVAPFLGNYVEEDEYINSTWVIFNSSSLSAPEDVAQNTFIPSSPNASIRNYSGISNLEDTFTSTSFMSSPSALPFVSKLLNVSGESFNQSVIHDVEDTFRNVDGSGTFALPQVFYGYAIIGSIALFVTLLFVIVCVIAPADETTQKTDQVDDELKQSKTFIGAIVLLTFLLLFVELSVQMGYGQAVATYAVKGPLRLTDHQGSYISSVYWTAFTISRFCAIFYVLKFSNLSLILFSLTITTAGAFVLLFVQVQWALWLASFLVGFGVSPFFSSAIAWIEQYITVTNKFVALFSTGYCFGEMIGPYVITSFVEETPEALSYMVAASCVISLPLILGMYLMLRNKPKKYRKKEGVSNENCDANLDNENYM
ncbi:hypothetical protein JTE90_024604 [Oedothorax gibbosus]|uniref:Sodium-dependent glucose transporter 1 n=1 Tax=Oedothorax gibbosus TaxID=931172 RepID=A0AAV6U0X7_9ARAC|nr:hypothetical protein JTE90_024604 [Oedothorax gibbosus]